MRYKIADCITEYEPHYEMLRQKMESYRFEGEGEAEISLQLTKSFCEEKQKEQSHLTEAQCEYIFAGSEFYRKFIRKGGMMLHASAVEVDGKAYLFRRTAVPENRHIQNSGKSISVKTGR